MTVQHLMNAFLRRLLLRMKELGLNNSSLARRMNVSRVYVGKVMRGDVNITFGTALRFAKALQMDFIPDLVPQEEETRDEVSDTGLPPGQKGSK